MPSTPSSSESNRIPSPLRGGADLRSAYLDYFQSKAQARAANPDGQLPPPGNGELKSLPHPRVASSPLIPPDDPTLMFASAGMVQFKRLYSGDVDPLPYPRATTCQKCLRAGGKGSDLEQVGKTLRHHTLFEMLGNFSFGDYFKREAVRFAWEFCTSPSYMALPADRIFATVYGPTADKPQIPMDDEARSAWLEESDDLARRGLVPTGMVNPIIPLDEKENFWGPAGDTGACGPCSEIKFFIGPPEALAKARALAVSDPDALGKRIINEGDTFLEIWNMVFPQFDQQRDGTRRPLKNRGIDTGAGLERMTVALQWWHQGGKVMSPYETDLLWPIVQAASEATGIPYVRVADAPDDPEIIRRRQGINAIVDHVRAIVFCLAEGITPSNDGRGYVVRRIQRRALRYARLLGVREPFLYKLVDTVANCPAWIDPKTGDHIYPEIVNNIDAARRTVRIEEERFLRTLDQGMRILDDVVEAAKGGAGAVIRGEDIFKLHATFGFPPDLTREIAEDAGLAFDEDGYRAAMKQHQTEAKKSWKGAELGEEGAILEELADRFGPTPFLGYVYDREISDAAHPERTPRAEIETRVLAVIRGKEAVDEAKAQGDGGSGSGHAKEIKVSVILEETNFYAESGGQVGDTGEIRIAAAGGRPAARFIVEDTRKTPDEMIIHRGRLVEGAIRSGDAAIARPDWERRWAIMRNHSVTHLLQAALRKVVGTHVTQSGSWVGPDALRFDFSNMEAVSRESLDKIEHLVNESIAADRPIETDELPLEEARKRGAIAPFGEKYGARVRVVQMGDISIEFCGGTHLRRTGQALRFRVLGESSIAAGIRRIEAAAGMAAYPHEVADRRVLDAITQRVQARGEAAIERIEALQTKLKDLEKEIAKMKQSQGASQLDDLIGSAVELPGGVKLVVGNIAGMGPQELRALADQAHRKAGENTVILLATVEADKVSLVCISGMEAKVKYPANKAVNAVAALLDGKGGGRPDMAQAGAKNVAALPDAIAKAQQLIAAVAQS